jgi:hypothetical protein
MVGYGVSQIPNKINNIAKIAKYSMGEKVSLSGNLGNLNEGKMSALK